MNYCPLLLLFLAISCSSDPETANEPQSLSDYQNQEEKDRWETQQKQWSANSRKINKSLKSRKFTHDHHNEGFVVATAPRYGVTDKQLDKLFKLAREGNTDAQCQLGLCYKYGIGLEIDMSKAFKWLKKAADQGHSKAKRIYLYMIK